MKYLVAALLCLSAAIAPAQFAKNRVRLLKHLDLTAFQGSPTGGSGCAGYVSPSGREYAIIGLRNGNAVVEITKPLTPTIVAHISGPSSIWHEVAVMGHYAYAVTEAGGGVQIIDLTQVDSGIATLAGTFPFSGTGRSHTVQGHSPSKTVYLNGTAGYANGGIVALDCTNPTSPVILGTWEGTYVHDCTIFVPTSGPYAGKEMIFACVGAKGIRILDASDKANITQIAAKSYLDTGTYCHSGSVSPDGKYFFANDEFDENTGVFNSATTHVFDIQDLMNPIYLGTYQSGTAVIDHNSMVQNGHLMLAAYKGGLRVYDASSPVLKETGFLDTYPEGEGFDYEGAWGVFAGFPSGNVIVSDINRGLFVLDPSEAQGFGAPIVSVSGDDGNSTRAKALRKPDGHFQAYQPSRSGSVYVRFETGTPSPTNLSLKIKGKSSARKGHLLTAWFNRSGRWVQGATWNLGSKNEAVAIKGTSANGIVDGAGAMEIRLDIRPLSPGRLDLDSVQIYANGS